MTLQTLRLNAGITASEAQRAWAGSDTRGLARLMDTEGAELWLYRRLRALEVTGPEAFLRELRAAAQRVAVSALRVDAQTAAVIGVLAGAGLPFALIKGQARRAAAGRYPYADARGVVDVDVLLPEHRAREGWELLLQRGYQPCYPDPTPWTVTHHLPALWDGNRVSVELHVTTADTVAPDEAWRRATEGPDAVTWEGTSVSAPNATELLWQGLAHAVRDGTKGCRLSALLNGAAILAEHPPIQWGVVEERITAGEVRDHDDERPVSDIHLRRWLTTAAGLAGTTLPPALASAGRIDLARLLRWRGTILHSRLGPSVQDRLLEEGARRELRMPLSPAVKGTGVFPRARRRTTSLAARILYTGWRAAR